MVDENCQRSFVRLFRNAYSGGSAADSHCVPRSRDLATIICHSIKNGNSQPTAADRLARSNGVDTLASTAKRRLSLPGGATRRNGPGDAKPYFCTASITWPVPTT